MSGIENPNALPAPRALRPGRASLPELNCASKTCCKFSAGAKPETRFLFDGADRSARAYGDRSMTSPIRRACPTIPPASRGRTRKAANIIRRAVCSHAAYSLATISPRTERADPEELRGSLMPRAVVFSVDVRSTSRADRLIASDCRAATRAHHHKIAEQRRAVCLRIRSRLAKLTERKRRS
jgi:hypothetical protein